MSKVQIRASNALATLRWPEPLAGMDPSSRMFAVALAISIALHGLMLSLSFRFPQADRMSAPTSLEVVFVNSKTRARPVRPDALAQANLDGGGNTDLDRRARTPLPVLKPAERGAELTEMNRRQQELEARQQQLLSQLSSQAQVQPGQAQPEQAEVARRSGRDLAQSALAVARLEAQISRNIDEYNKRPRKQFVGARVAEYRFAQYVEDWRQKVERIGNLNYPESARGRIYGSLRMAVSIHADGSLAGFDLERSSGHRILDAAAERIVTMGAPYARFSSEMSRDTDILVITRTWHFAQGDRLLAE